MNNGFEDVAVYFLALGMKYPVTDGSRLISQQIAALGVNKDEPDGLVGTFSGAIAAFFECSANRSNF